MPESNDTLGATRESERRQRRERRRHARMARDRRGSARRRRRVRTLLLAFATAAFPGTIKPPLLLPGVSVSMNDFRAVRAQEAYDDLIEEAATLYALDANLIRGVMQAESSFNP